MHLPIYVQDRFVRTSSNGRYGAAVHCIDWSTEVLLRELESLSLDHNTVVVFTSDNGALRLSSITKSLPRDCILVNIAVAKIPPDWILRAIR